MACESWGGDAQVHPADEPYFLRLRGRLHRALMAGRFGEVTAQRVSKQISHGQRSSLAGTCLMLFSRRMPDHLLTCAIRKREFITCSAGCLVWPRACDGGARRGMLEMNHADEYFPQSPAPPLVRPWQSSLLISQASAVDSPLVWCGSCFSFSASSARFVGVPAAAWGLSSYCGRRLCRSV